MDSKIKIGAGLFFVCTDDNSALLFKRSQASSEPGTWGISGGGNEPGETPGRTALRETQEELGSIPRGKLIDLLKNTGAGWKYSVFTADISLEEKLTWTPQIKLNHEHSELKWFKLESLPVNLHSVISIIKN